MKPCYLIICVATLAYSGVSESLHSLPPVSINIDISSHFARDSSSSEKASGDGWFAKLAGSKPKDCAEIQALGFTDSGIYTVYVGESQKPVQVYCDLDTNGGGWLIFQRRRDGFEDFYRGWSDYAVGFGDLYGEFWLGNHVIYQLTTQKAYTLRVELVDLDGVSKVAEYSTFSIGAPFQKYALNISGYSGNASDALSHVSGAAFTTKDRDNDIWYSNCAQKFKGAWWYAKCHSANLNGFYYGGPHSSYADGVNWINYYYSYPLAQMKIRPTVEQS